MAKQSATKAAADAKVFLRQFKSLSSFAESVSNLGDVESIAHDIQQSIDQAKLDLASLKKKISDAKRRYEAVESDISKAKAEHDAETKKASTLAGEIVANAKKDAKEIISKAEGDMVSIRQKASDEVSAHERWKVAADRERKGLESELRELRKIVSNLNVQFGVGV